MTEEGRFVVGIDLGTTHSCVYWSRLHEKPAHFQLFQIPQLVAGGTLEKRGILPSALFLSSPGQADQYKWKMPWDEVSRSYSVGEYADRLGQKQPGRFVGSAKSWLCHSRLHRTDPVLPLHVDQGIERISPLRALSRILEHIRLAWDHVQKEPLEEQTVVITLPASFDEVARKLTLEAAYLAGFPKGIHLLEEPQAAFYSYLSKEGVQALPAGSRVLVCDVGGGTTDFSLIEVQEKEHATHFERIAVGEHLLLGGDNLDAFLQRLLCERLQVPNMSLDRSLRLRHEAQKAKEALLSGQERYEVVLEGEGSSVVGSAKSISLHREEVCDLLLKGFFGDCQYEEGRAIKRGLALKAMGLPYAYEPSIIKQLANFLIQSGVPEGEAPPTHVLFNGGSMKPSLFQEAVIRNLHQWFGHKPKVLPSSSLDTSVAKGACYYGRVKHGEGITIYGGSARTFYLGLQGKKGEEKLLTVIPKGAPDHYHYLCPQPFKAKLNTPVRFLLHSSHMRRGDKAGDFVELAEDEAVLLPPLYTSLEVGKKAQQEQAEVEVQVHASYNNLGVVELTLEHKETGQKWQLDFDLQSTPSASRVKKESLQKSFTQQQVSAAENIIHNAFQGRDPEKLVHVMNDLETSLGESRAHWPAALLRELWEVTFSQYERRKVSSAFAKRWWHAIGFFLRPGTGYPLDERRVKRLWKLLLEDFQTPLKGDGALAQTIALRRIAPGLSRGQQVQIAAKLLPGWMTKNLGSSLTKERKNKYQYLENMRLFAALERLDPAMKQKVGSYLLGELKAGRDEAVACWALARLGSRSPICGSLNVLIAPKLIESWIEELLSLDLKNKNLHFVLTHLGQQSGDFDFDLQPSVYAKLKKLLGENYLNPMDKEASIDEAFLGDELPIGLELVESL